jgi:hypothetical protein
MAGNGIPQTEIAMVMGISKTTLRKHCAVELDTGATEANNKVATFLFTAIVGYTEDDDGAPVAWPITDDRARMTGAIFWLKTRGGWYETSIHKHTGVAGGDPIELKNVEADLDRKITRTLTGSTTEKIPPESE